MPLTSWLRVSDKGQRRRSFVLQVEVLEDRLQPGSLLLGQDWGLLAGNAMDSERTRNDPARANHFRSIPLEDHSRIAAVAAVVNAGGRTNDYGAVPQPAAASDSFHPSARFVPDAWLSLSAKQAATPAPAAHHGAPNSTAAAIPLTAVQASVPVVNQVAPTPSAIPTHGPIQQNPGGAASQNWATYVTGTLSTATAQAVTVDSAGNSYVTGSIGGGANKTAFVAAYDQTGVQLFLTKFQAKDVAETPNVSYSRSEGHAIGLDGNGNIYVTGQAVTTRAPAHQDAFIMRLDSSGHVDASYGVGFNTGLGPVSGNGIVVTADGTATIVGTAQFGAEDIFMAQIAPDNSIPVLSTFPFQYGFAISPGSFKDAQGQQVFRATAGAAVALSADGNTVYVSGTGTRMNGDRDLMVMQVNLATPLLPNPSDFLQPLLNGGVSYIDSAGWSGAGIVSGPDGTVYQTGTAAVNGVAYAIAIHWTADLSTTAYQRYDENTAGGSGTGIAVDGSGNVYLTGTALDPTNQNQRALVDVIDPAIQVVDTLLIAINGDGQEAGYGIVYQDGTVNVVGNTSSTNLSTDNTILNASDKDAFLASVGSFGN